MSRSWPRSSTERGLPGAPALPALALVLSALLAATAPGRAEDPTPAALRERARSVLADARYQRQLSSSRGSGARGGDLGDAPRMALPPPVLAALGSARLAQLVLLVLAGAALALLALWAFRFWRARRRKAAPAAVPPSPAGGEARPPLAGDAERLLAAGRYAEAVHALLLHALRQLADRFRVAIPPSRTSREILALLPLKAERREALAELVRTVERSLFGGAPVGREDYERSLAQAGVVLDRGGAA